MRCASGCVWPCGAADCAGEACGVCVPAQADVGVVCRWCWARLQRSVYTAPSLVEHLFDEAGAVRLGAGGRAVVGSAPGSRVLYPAAMAAADEVFACLAFWASRCGAPPLAGAWRDGEGAVVGVRRRGHTRELVEWWRPRLEWCVGQAWAGEMCVEVGRVTSRIAARWPVEEPVRRVRFIACPECGVASLVEIPPVCARGPRVVVCEMPRCSVSMGEDEWAQVRARALAAASGVERDAA